MNNLNLREENPQQENSRDRAESQSATDQAGDFVDPSGKDFIKPRVNLNLDDYYRERSDVVDEYEQLRRYEEPDDDEIIIEPDEGYQFGSSGEKELLLVWEAPNTGVRKQSVWSRLAVLVILLAILIFTMISGNWTTFFVVLAVGILFVVFGRTDAGIVENKIYSDGIETDGSFYSFDEIKAFSIEYSKSIRELTLYTTKGLIKVVPIQIGAADPNVLRAVLGQVLPEVGSRITVIDRIIRMLRI